MASLIIDMYISAFAIAEVSVSPKAIRLETPHFAENYYSLPDSRRSTKWVGSSTLRTRTRRFLEKQRDDGGTEYLHFYKDESLSQEAAASRENGQDHDHITFYPDGSLKYDSTQL